MPINLTELRKHAETNALGLTVSVAPRTVLALINVAEAARQLWNDDPITLTEPFEYYCGDPYGLKDELTRLAATLARFDFKQEPAA